MCPEFISQAHFSIGKGLSLIHISYQGVTKPVWEGGLGFDYKWDLGWMHDTLSYFQADAKERQEKYHKQMCIRDSCFPPSWIN